MMDITFRSVARLYEQGYSQKHISRQLNLSEQKVKKILITLGLKETPEAKMFASGMTVDEICEATGKSRINVYCVIPYTKWMYFAEYPSRNTLNLRRWKEKKRQEENDRCDTPSL